VAGKPGPDIGVLVGAVVVQDHVNGLVGRDAALDLVQEVEKLLMAVTGHVLGGDLAGQNIERGKERRGAVALIVVGHGRAASLLQWQPRLGAVKGLYLRLFIDRQDHRMGGRCHIKTDHITQLIDKSRIVRQLELPPAVRCKAMRLPDVAHG